LTVGLLVARAIPVAIEVAGFLPLMADAVSSGRIARIVRMRMAAMGVTTTLTTLLAGPVLMWLSFLLSFQSVFFVGCVAALVSSWQVWCIRAPAHGSFLPSSSLHSLFRSRRPSTRHFRRYLVFVVVLRRASA
jgi:hypothetical protein